MVEQVAIVAKLQSGPWLIPAVVVAGGKLVIATAAPGLPNIGMVRGEGKLCSCQE